MRPTLLILLTLTLTLTLTLHAQTPNQSPADQTERAQLHRTPEWAAVEAHLPDPKTATAAQLETAADVLRARRFQYDAADFYQYAIDRLTQQQPDRKASKNPDIPRLMNRLGMVELELRHPALARAYFLRGAALQKKNAQLWNNAGAAEFLAGSFRPALFYYNKAARLDKKNAIFHSNLATVYFEMNDFESARRQWDIAFQLDPHLYDRKDTGGVEARVFSSTNHGRFCFELARNAARRADDPGVLNWLTKSGESGYDIQAGIMDDKLFEPYRKDPRILLIIQNARALQSHRTIATAPIPPLTQ